MQKSLMIGITEKDMQAVINTYDLKPYYYPTLFPLKENYTLTWKALEAQVGLKIAGDLVARGASINKRPAKLSRVFRAIFRRWLLSAPRTKTSLTNTTLW